MLNSRVKKQISNTQDGIKKIRAQGAKMILDRTSNGEFGKVQDILDSIISEF